MSQKKKVELGTSYMYMYNVTLLVTLLKKEFSLELLSPFNKCSISSQNRKDFMLIL